MERVGNDCFFFFLFFFFSAVWQGKEKTKEEGLDGDLFPTGRASAVLFQQGRRSAQFGFRSFMINHVY